MFVMNYLYKGGRKYLLKKMCAGSFKKRQTLDFYNNNNDNKYRPFN